MAPSQRHSRWPRAAPHGRTAGVGAAQSIALFGPHRPPQAANDNADDEVGEATGDLRRWRGPDRRPAIAKRQGRRSCSAAPHDAQVWWNGISCAPCWSSTPRAWRWGSLDRWKQGTAREKALLARWLLAWPGRLGGIRQCGLQTAAELARLCRGVTRSCLYRDDPWWDQMERTLPAPVFITNTTTQF